MSPLLPEKPLYKLRHSMHLRLFHGDPLCTDIVTRKGDLWFVKQFFAFSYNRCLSRNLNTAQTWPKCSCKIRMSLILTITNWSSMDIIFTPFEYYPCISQTIRHHTILVMPRSPNSPGCMHSGDPVRWKLDCRQTWNMESNRKNSSLSQKQ